MAPIVLESAVYTELMFCYGLQQILFLYNVVWNIIHSLLIFHTKTPPPFHDLISNPHALKLCPSALTPNNVV
jgi:hypothetical protein